MLKIITFIAALCVCAIAAGVIAYVVTRDTDRERAFPADFKFGAATAAYQIEGAWNVSDKGPSIWDHMTHTEPWRVLREHNGDVAADSYNQYLRDVEMLGEIGADFYRFSISWPRILPTGYSHIVSEDGVAYYNRLINALLANGIEPMITLYHWDLPQKLQDLGGWANPFIQDWFADYARVAFQNFGDRVKIWATFNEVHMICQFGYGSENLAPVVNAHGVGEYLCTYNVLLAHAKAYHMYNDDFRPTQNGRVGYVSYTGWYEPLTDTPEDRQAAEDAMLFNNGLYTHPIFSTEGDFPQRVKEMIAAKSSEQGFARSRLPEFTGEQVAYIRGTADFYGFNHYSTSLVYRNSSVIGIYPPSMVPGFHDDLSIGSTIDPEWLPSNSPWLFTVPWGIRRALNDVKSRYNNVEIMITENGYASAPGLDDWDRVNHMRQYWDEILSAIIEDEVRVTYFAMWSLLDNFEWLQGYTQHFGIYETNYEHPQRTRTARLSSRVYSHMISSRVVDYDYVPGHNEIIIINPIIIIGERVGTEIHLVPT